MYKVKRLSVKIMSCLLVFTMLMTFLPFGTSAVDAVRNALKQSDKISFATISDVHYYPAELTGNYCSEFMEYVKGGIGREPFQSVGILDSALAAIGEHADTKGIKYLIVPGDLTSNGEYEAHIRFAERLECFERETGVQVMVIDGNHDINAFKAATTFENGKLESARATTPEEFREIYKNLGYDIAFHTYTPSTGKANMLSYSVSLDGYRFIFMDITKYSADITSCGRDKNETGGKFSDEFLAWVLDEIADAKAHGETVIGINHQNLVPHYESEYAILRGFMTDGFEEVTDKLADAGMHFALTGHLHFNAVDSTVTDDGETINEINTDSLTAFPNYFREFDVTTDGSGKTTMKIESQEVDCVKSVTVNGYTYERPFRLHSLADSFYDESGISGMADRVLTQLLVKYSERFVENGIINSLKTDFDVDVENILSGYFGEGLKIGKYELFTTKNLMGFINDISRQIELKYLTNPEATADFIVREIDKLMDIQVSDLPNTRFYEDYGVGDPNRPGTFGEMFESILIYMYEGFYDVHDDEFMMDVVDNFENRDIIFKLFDVCVDVVANDILQGKLLKDLSLNIGSFFPKGTTLEDVGNILSLVFKVVFMGDTSYLNISDKVLSAANKLGIVEYSSLWGIVEHYMDEYLTDAQLEGISQNLAKYILDFTLADSSHDTFSPTLVYDGKVSVEATRDNYRLPNITAVTFGKDQTSRNLSWYTKTSVKGTDIEIIPYSDHPVFSGRGLVPVGVTVDKQTVRTQRSYPGVDLGIVGVMNYEFPMNRHLISVSGLKPGARYSFRVGDASRNWWSEAGSFEIADGGDETTFLHVSDPQSQTARQYDTFADLMRTATAMYGDNDFVINTGDCVDSGDNFNQWKYLFGQASDTLMNTVMMAASGNHEEKGSYATVTNFYISNAPEQDTEEGIYYSFDYNNVHFAVLNTNNLDSDKSLNDEQIDWLIEDMQSSGADWKFVAFHKAAYSDGSHFDDKDVCKIRDQLSVLMPQLGIDMVFQGHDHVYLRTDAMIDNKVEDVKTTQTEFNGKTYNTKESPAGTVYVISACSGVKVYKMKDPALTDKYFPRAEAIYDAQLPAFSGVRIVGDTLYFDAYTVDNGSAENIDSFAIHKDLSVPKGTGVPEKSPFRVFLDKIMDNVAPVLLKLLNRLLDLLQIRVFNLFGSNTAV